MSLAKHILEIMRHFFIFRYLKIVKTFASVTVICSESTSFLSQSETTTRIWVDGIFFTLTGASKERQGDFLQDGRPIETRDYPGLLTALWLGVLNNDADLQMNDNVIDEIEGISSDRALLVAASKAGALPKEVQVAYPREDTIRYDQSGRLMITTHDVIIPDEDVSPFLKDSDNDWQVVTMKGEPSTVLSFCEKYQTIKDDTTRDPIANSDFLDELINYQIGSNYIQESPNNDWVTSIKDASELMMLDSLRPVGVAYKIKSVSPEQESTTQDTDIDSNFTFVGLLGIVDNALPGIQSLIEKVHIMGIRTLMVTEDNSKIAGSVAEKIGLLRPDHKICTRLELNLMSDVDLQKAIQEFDVFSEITSDHSPRIIQALQANREVVALLGIRETNVLNTNQSDTGRMFGVPGQIVVGDKADIALTDIDYLRLINAITMSLEKIKKFKFFLFSTLFTKIALVLFTMLMVFSLPFSGIQFLWLILVDGMISISLIMDKATSHSIKDPYPLKKKTKLNPSLVIQPVIQTGSFLFLFYVFFHKFSSGLFNFQFFQMYPQFLHQSNWLDDVLPSLSTLTFVTVLLSDLFFAYTVRSDKESFLRIGVFSNPYMQYASLIVIAISIFQVVFHPCNITPLEWVIAICIALIPAISYEIIKLFPVLVRGQD